MPVITGGGGGGGGGGGACLPGKIFAFEAL